MAIERLTMVFAATLMRIVIANSVTARPMSAACQLPSASPHSLAMTAGRASPDENKLAEMEEQLQDFQDEFACSANTTAFRKAQADADADYVEETGECARHGVRANRGHQPGLGAN